MAEAGAASSGTTTSTTTSGDTTTTGGGTTTTAAPDWTTGFNDETKAYVSTKGFKNPVEVIESYRNFEKLQGAPAEHILKLPQNMDSPEGRAIFERLGLPKEAKEYKIEIPKEHGDEAFSNWLRDTAHKTGMTKKQVEGFTASWNERAGALNKTSTDTHALSLQTAENNLKKEWGSAFDQNKGLADIGAKALGLDQAGLMAMRDTMGADKAMMFLHKMGLKAGEAEFVSGGAPNSGVMTPAGAKARIDALIVDQSFQARINKGDAEALKEWNNLHQWQSAGQMVNF